MVGIFFQWELDLSLLVYTQLYVCKNGGIIIYPTDTLYGFGVDATNSESIDKINKLKKMNSPLSIIVGSLDMLEKFATLNSNYKLKIKNYFHLSITCLYILYIIYVLDYLDLFMY